MTKGVIAAVGVAKLAEGASLRRIGDGEDLKGAAEFASPAQMRARERPLRCSVEGEQQGTLTFTQRISLIAVYESSGRDDQPADHRICIRRAPGSRARAACPICRRRNAARMLGSNPLRLNDFTMGQQRSNTRVGSRPSVASCSSET